MSMETTAILPELLFLNVGLPVNVEWDGKTVFTGFIKKPVPHSVGISADGLEQDGQGDLKNHGGPDKAACVYSADHYPWWSEQMNRPFEAGAFGENFTVSGLREDQVRIGDVYRIGTAVVQVSQPRQPCFKLSAHLERKEMILRVRDTGFSGFYFRVLEPGQVTAGDRFAFVRHEGNGSTIADCNQVLYHERGDTPLLRQLLDEPALASSLHKHLSKRIG
ncbi:MOSC domain-containing protein [Paenibacillus wulumuqiensis]|uniref:MOSC domain-containing protein n=1 Tax=Paenibacillus wulumuqiensis TaxID=1567107 RepID=UPI000619ED96|nr:MOSC domain-containing protein [Paenibacillus wulumuqiensis]